jgi:glucokinase
MISKGVIGLDLGGTKLAGAIFTSSGRILDRQTVSLAGRRGRAVGALIRRQLGDLLEAARARGVRIRAVGIAVPGISCARTGRVWAPNIPGWGNYPLHREILRAVRNQRIRVAIDSDRACYILGETWRGVARNCRDAIFLAVGTGIGAGILSGGRILRGAHDSAGAIGWLALDRPFRREYVHCGCFEHCASGEGLSRMATKLLAERETRRRAKGYRLTKLPGYKGITAPEVFAACARRDPLAMKVIGQAVEFWGMAVANLVSLFNPEKIIFGGGVFGPGARFIDDIYAEARKWAQPISIKKVKLHASKLGGDAGLYGAGCLALQAAKKYP